MFMKSFIKSQQAIKMTALSFYKEMPCCLYVSPFYITKELWSHSLNNEIPLSYGIQISAFVEYRPCGGFAYVAKENDIAKFL